MTAYLRALDAHREAQRTPSLRQRVVIAVGDAIELLPPCDHCGTHLACEHLPDVVGIDEYRAFGALDAAIPHLSDAGIAAVAEALGVKP